jgi:hypothetical protein
MKRHPRLIVVGGIAALLAGLPACGSSSAPTDPSPPSSSGTAALTITFTDNPVPFRSSACNASNPQGWYTQAKIQETGGVSFTAASFTQKVDGSTVGFLNESFNSRFGSCTGGTFSENVIPANGSVCGIVGVCTSSTYSNYQFTLSGTDANGHALTVTSPLLQFGSRPTGQAVLAIPWRRRALRRQKAAW